MARVEQPELRRSAAQFGWLTIGLSTAAVSLFVLAVVLTVNGDTDTDREPGRVLLPLDVELENPGAAVLLAAACWSQRPSSAWLPCRRQR